MWTRRIPGQRSYARGGPTSPRPRSPVPTSTASYPEQRAPWRGLGSGRDLGRASVEREWGGVASLGHPSTPEVLAWPFANLPCRNGDSGTVGPRRTATGSAVTLMIPRTPCISGSYPGWPRSGPRAVRADRAVHEPLVHRSERRRTPKPRRAAVPGRRLWMNTSARSASDRAPRVRVVARSSASERLPGVCGLEEHARRLRSRRPPGACLVAAARVLHLDHVRAERTEDLRAVRPGERRRDVENADAGERPEVTGQSSRLRPGRCRRLDGVDQWLIDVVSGSPWTYLADLRGRGARRVLPRSLPSESVLITAGVVCAQGDLRLEIVILPPARSVRSRATTRRTSSAASSAGPSCTVPSRREGKHALDWAREDARPSTGCT